MSTLNSGDNDLAYEQEAKRLSEILSLDSLNLWELAGVKSESQLEVESKAKEEKVDHLIAHTAKTSLCFLVDCTGSMRRWIDKVKENIMIWSDQFHEQYTNMELHVGFVRYTDYDQPRETRTTWMDFTTDLVEFHHFVVEITTPDGVGGDTAEDVFGGLDAMLKLSWPNVGTKVLIHIADAPCHGTNYHNLTYGDSHRQGDPAGLQLDDLMKQLVEKRISYYFAYINKDLTEKMIKAFNASLQTQSSKMLSIKQFDVSNPNSLLEGVFKSVTCSITATLEVLASGGARRLRDYIIQEGIPDWESLGSHQALVSRPHPIGQPLQMKVPHQPITVKIAPQPFAEGSQKIVYHAYDEQDAKHIVLKRSKWTDAKSNSPKRCLETAMITAIATNFAAEFNRELPLLDNVCIQFMEVGVMVVREGSKSHYYTYEPHMNLGSSGEYTKFNSNFLYTHSTAEHDDPTSNDTCQAFSHYTWVKSEKRLVICDLQGVRSHFKLILTDPAIHYTSILCHGSTNLGIKGIQIFFQMHKCNDICRALKLDKSLPEQPSPTTPATTPTNDE